MDTAHSNSRIEQPLPNHTRRFSLLQGLATSFAAFFVFNLALGLLFYGFIEMLTANADSENALSLILLAGGFFTIGFLLLPPIVLSLYRFSGWNMPAWISSLRLPPLAGLILLYPLILIAGDWVSNQTFLAYLLLPLCHIAAIGIPIAILLQISVKGLTGVSPQRQWGALSVGLTLSPFVIMILEILAFIFPLILLAFWASLDATRLTKLYEIAETLRQPSINSQTAINILQPYLTEPAVVFTLLFFAGLVVPLIEEAIKPLGIWFLYGRTRGALDGFVAGALCGAGYALIESFLLGNSSSEWLFAVLGRSGTGAIHIFTSAFVGAALTTAWHRRRYWQLILAYLIAVFFHGAWNGFAILSALRSISTTEQGFWQLPYTQNLATIAPLAILLLGGLTILGLWSLNRQIRKGL